MERNTCLGSEGEMVNGSNGFFWPQRNYTCSFCKRQFNSAQALGGHMNVHRRDRAMLIQLPSWVFECQNPKKINNNNNNNDTKSYPNPSFSSSSTSLSSSSSPSSLCHYSHHCFPSPPLTSFSSSLSYNNNNNTSKIMEKKKSHVLETHSLLSEEFSHKKKNEEFKKYHNDIEVLKKNEVISLELEIGCKDPKEVLDLELRLGCF